MTLWQPIKMPPCVPWGSLLVSNCTCFLLLDPIVMFPTLNELQVTGITSMAFEWGDSTRATLTGGDVWGSHPMPPTTTDTISGVPLETGHCVFPAKAGASWARIAARVIKMERHFCMMFSCWCTFTSEFQRDRRNVWLTSL